MDEAPNEPKSSGEALSWTLAVIGAGVGALIGVLTFGPATWGTSIAAGIGFAAGRLGGLAISSQSRSTGGE